MNPPLLQRPISYVEAVGVHAAQKLRMIASIRRFEALKNAKLIKRS